MNIFKAGLSLIMLVFVFNANAQEYPVGSDHVSKILSIPMYPELCDEQINYIIKVIRSFYADLAC